MTPPTCSIPRVEKAQHRPKQATELWRGTKRAVIEMRLPLAPRERLLQCLLLLTLMLIAVCGVPMETHQSPGAQPRAPQQKRNVETSEDQQLDGSTLDTASSFPANFQNDQDVPGDPMQAFSIAGFSDTEYKDDKQGDDGAQEKPGLSSMEEQKHIIINTLVSNMADFFGCEPSVSCKSVLLILYVNFMTQDLPSCPCTYLSEIMQDNMSLYDQNLKLNVTWRDDTSPSRLPPNSSTHFCLRSELSDESIILASQQCCYDSQGHLLTQGNGAGTPDFISPDFSPTLYPKLSQTLWVQCEEEWSQYRAVLPPNNGLSCPENPIQD